MSSAKPAPAAPAAGQVPGRMVSLRLESKPVIYASYMSFTEHGGVFLPTSDSYEMGEEVLLVLELVTPAKTEKLFVKTSVCWINSNPSAGGRPKGIGLAFGSDDNSIKTKQIFEALLSGLLHSDHPTYTM
ncbi:PilZ domain-containing protein [Conchiformibius steedae]|uniref:Pilus assembly protein n=1 Tax=Conchiformibius steedae TaxID=153493 RepID=A0A3P2ABQ7_9NEIS|nr:pilus assembly protein [Conchiformibius steedae]RRD91630.1 pilus assembly protein [Conchiformibius steedae]